MILVWQCDPVKKHGPWAVAHLRVVTPPAIPFRNLMNRAHPNAAAIDVGATLHMAAVRADRAPEPVRSFGTFTTDLPADGDRGALSPSAHD